MTDTKNWTDRQKLDYIIKNETLMTKATFNGHKHTNGDEFEEARKLISQFRKDLGLIRKD